MPVGDTEALLYAQVRRSMIESGDWEQVLSVLRARLNDVGWFDDVKSKAKEGSRQTDFQTVLGQVGPDALASLPPTIRKEVMTMIKRTIEKRFE